ncbi:MAG: DUF4432 family protein [Silicimonas sp.]|nr:DUF4432 family protein [Silicimonas sp.]
MRLHLSDAMFGAKEVVLVSAGDFAVHAFRYGSGVAALRLTSPRAELIVLPFKGQQIWRAAFDGVDVTMGSMFAEPVDTRVYLETYGAFLLHCGLTAMGGPGPEDTHPLHGELPNAPFQEAWIELREGALVLGGAYRHAVAFTVNYRATFEITLRADESAIGVTAEVENLRGAPMELMYLAHANFRPVDGGELIYGARVSPETVRVRRSIPAHITPPPGYAEFLEALAEDPERHHVLRPDLAFDPEVVFEIDMRADAGGWCHGMQKHPDGSADFISYDQANLPRATRWICRTADQQGLGILFPSTAGVEGYTAEKAKGRIIEIDPHGSWSIAMKMGRLDAAGTRILSAGIDQLN